MVIKERYDPKYRYEICEKNFKKVSKIFKRFYTTSVVTFAYSKALNLIMKGHDMTSPFTICF